VHPRLAHTELLQSVYLWQILWSSDSAKAGVPSNAVKGLFSAITLSVLRSQYELLVEGIVSGTEQNKEQHLQSMMGVYSG